MRDPLTKKVVDIAPSGIRKFFDIVSEMDNVISLGVGEPDLTRPGTSVTRVSTAWKKAGPSTPPMRA